MPRKQQHAADWNKRNEQLTRDQDDLLAQLQAWNEAHESALAEQLEGFSKERDAEQERHVQALEARSVEQQEAQAKELEVLEQPSRFRTRRKHGGVCRARESTGS